MRTTEEARLSFENMREDIVDPFLFQKGFSRANNSDVYEKKADLYAHEIWFEPDFDGPPLRMVEMTVDPIVRWRLRGIAEKVLELTGNDIFLVASVPDLVVAQSIRQFVVGNTDLWWRASSRGQYTSVGQSICEFMGKNIIPLLASMQTIDHLIRIYETNDPRIIKQRHWYVYVAAAYFLRDEFEKGRAVIEEHLGRPGLRKRFAPIFEYLSRLPR